MALVKCPECGNDISTNAKTCPHCGTAIKICPDCGAVYAGSPPTCGNCGFMFTKTSSPLDEPSSGESIMEKWLDRASADKKINGFLKYAGKALYVLNVIVAVATIALFYAWFKKAPDERVFSAKETIRNINICVVFGCIIYLIAAVNEFTAERIIQIRFSNWLAASNIDAKEYLKVHQNDTTTDKNANSDFLLIANGEYFRDNPGEKHYFYVISAVKIVLSTVSAILFGCCISENMQIIMDFIFWEQPVDFSKLNYVLIAVAAAAMLISFITGMILASKQDVKFENWLYELLNPEPDE